MPAQILGHLIYMAGLQVIEGSVPLLTSWASMKKLSLMVCAQTQPVFIPDYGHSPAMEVGRRISTPLADFNDNAVRGAAHTVHARPQDVEVAKFCP